MDSVSVIIPTYNRENFIGQAITSILNQTIKDCRLEIIVIDDGSTDRTHSVVKSFGRKVKYIYQENQGAGAARNRGIDECSGDWVAFLDSDDQWLPGKLAMQLDLIHEFPDFKATHTNFSIITETGDTFTDGLMFWWSFLETNIKKDWLNIYSEMQRSEKYGIFNGEIPFNIYTGNIFGVSVKRFPWASSCTLLVSRQCLDANIRFAQHLPMWEDYWFFCRLYEKYNILFADTPTIIVNGGHSGPRLTDLFGIESLRSYIDICEKIYFQSQSIYRPSDNEILKNYQNAQLDLIKEYIKIGMHSEALQLLNCYKSASFPIVSKKAYWYRLLLYLPHEVLTYLLNFRNWVLRR